MMKVKGNFAGLLMPGLTAIFAFSYYIAEKKRVKRLLKRHPKASQDLWVDAFNSGMDFQRGLILREEDADS